MQPYTLSIYLPPGTILSSYNALQVILILKVHHI